MLSLPRHSAKVVSHEDIDKVGSLYDGVQQTFDKIGVVLWVHTLTGIQRVSVI